MKYASLRLPDVLHDAINRSAEKNRRSMHAEILQAIEYYLKHAPEAQPDKDQAADQPTPPVK